MSDDAGKAMKEISERAMVVTEAIDAAGIAVDGTTTAALMLVIVSISQASGMGFEKFVATAAALWESLCKSPPKPAAVKEEPT